MDNLKNAPSATSASELASMPTVNQLEATISALSALQIAAPAVLTVGDVLSFYLRYCDSRGVHCADARADRLHTFRLFSEAQTVDRRLIGAIPVTEAKAFILSDFIDAQPGWKSSSTKRGKAGMIRAAFQWAVNEERIDRNPFRRVQYAEAPPKPAMPDPTLEMIAWLGNKRFEQAIRFARLTGCRLSELCRAVWADIDWEKGSWTIHKHKTRRYTGKAKTVALVPEAVALLRRLAAESLASAENAALGAFSFMAQPVMSAATDLIFRNNRGHKWTSRLLGQQLRRLKERHHIAEKATLHGCRHQSITTAIANGAAPKLVAEQHGQSSMAMIEKHYWHPGPEHIEALRHVAELGKPK